MTDEQIKKIVVDYAAFMLNEYSNGIDKDNAKSLCNDLKSFMQFLTKRYCVVERSKVMELYNEHLKYLKLSEDNNKIMAAAINESCMIGMHKLFGSETFNKKEI